MFGYLAADQSTLSPEQLARYRGCYCGLCRALGRRCGQASRMALAYDMAFLALLLASLYEPAEAYEARPCPVHPLRRVESWRSEAGDYAADLNVMLACLNCMDDWRDEKKLLRLGQAALLRRGAARARERQPEKWNAMEACMAVLRDAEARREPNPDVGAGAFGRLMGELLVWREDRWAPVLRRMGLELGRAIYLIDAYADFEDDEKKGLYNPLSALRREGATRRELQSILISLMSGCAAEYERLPLVQDVDILRSILYTGIWSRFTFADEKEDLP